MAPKDWKKSWKEKKTAMKTELMTSLGFSASLGKQAKYLEWIRNHLYRALPDITTEGRGMEVSQSIWLRD